MSKPTLLGISGSLRKDSFNRKLIREAARLFDGDFIEADLQMPLYDGDLESASGVPVPAQTLAEQIANADAVIISTPEYNQALSGVLKNALDWVSRTDGAPWKNKPVAIISAAAGRAGGARAQYSLRLAMNPFRPRLLTGPEVGVAGAQAEFNDDGLLTNKHYIKALTELMAALHADAKR
ncbi:NADPH-dependent FMN reductase [Pseudohalocynthiibacter aestuariivivens]|jgi:chromate reductase, NAD(P)H dehydrogenase (quinone)|uniref:NADPH-dependent FMN reductase n=1 Tax=Pseudohalocynthiibacter aestuariivivens TaxID=1591409 RepID=A0ABV5JK53_9RHOB|nr:MULTISPECIES: NAD(P)H-dependent oxidoreductase [Pseudohalocynthiibacter]MBS9715426.1 NAD(P)H-dependent oxidoreductase [Pseudohalocynthiibacter aestuariivivens]MCK0102628.1 NAD(P)H-dependent oxidoreductase [Pseudohalocynthiibacter sp. F2068]